MALPTAPSGDPTKWVNSDGLGLRLQCFLAVRDADRRIACVRLKEPGDAWSLPGETVRPNEELHAAARRVGEAWFGQALEARIADVLTWPDEGDRKWYILFVYEAPAPRGGLPLLPDTAEVAFAPPGKAPGPFGLDHGSVFARLRP